MDTKEIRQLNLDFKNTFGSDAGARVLDFLSAFCYEKATTYSPGDSGYTAFSEGKRSVILAIRRRVDAKLDEERPTQASNERVD